MSFRLHDSLTNATISLPQRTPGETSLYVCGPTVYGYIHVGNARPFVLFSLLKRYLTRTGMRVVLASNLTDVNDKIYAAAAREGVPSAELAERYGREYVADTDRLGLGRPDIEPKVTDAIPQIVAMIGRLVDRGLAYAAGGDVYFRVREFPGYGALSGRRPDEMLDTDPGPAKEHHLDFALWKGRKEGEDVFWDSPWGPGRPGWHIECSAMAHDVLGADFEIHGGGIDLIFPHHENEIAQSEGADGCRMAKLWVHNEMLELGGKMSKSDGNIVLLRDALADWPAEVLVMFFLRSHYRSKLPYSGDALRESDRAAERLRNTMRGLDRAAAAPGDALRPELARAVADARGRFMDALADDFNTPGALAALFEAAGAVNAAVDGAERPPEGQLQSVRTELATMLDLLGLGALAAPAGDDVPADVAALVERRAAARAAKDFAESDRLRDAIRDLGYDVRDTPDGQQVGPR